MEVNILEVAGLHHAVVGARNAKNSWHLSDSVNYEEGFSLGEKDKVLCQKLIKAGAEHRKFLRQIQVWLDLDLPRYIWQEFDTYKFNTKNSCSTMHKLFEDRITKDDFIYCEEDEDIAEIIISRLNQIREEWLFAIDNKDNKKKLRCLVRAKRLLMEGFLQLRTVNTNYEELRNIYHQRLHHGLKEEWEVVIEAIEQLPYFEEFIKYTGR